MSLTIQTGIAIFLHRYFGKNHQNMAYDVYISKNDDDMRKR